MLMELLLIGGLAAGIFGLSGSTWLFPCLASILHWFRLHKLWGHPRSNARLRGSGRGWESHSYPVSREEGSPRISIVIPCKNEAQVISETLTSINAAVESLREIHPEVAVEIVLGADGCSDNTASLAADLGAIVRSSSVSQGKWRTLSSICSELPHSDWIVLADAGVLWPSNFLIELYRHHSDFSCLALAPSYENPAAGLAERISWVVERFLKGIENGAGGPVSLHGATIAYRQFALREAFSRLCAERPGSERFSTVWFNDDVVIPLVVRSLFPWGHIQYLPSLLVSDSHQSGVRPREFGRRLRMVLGNAQWIQSLLPAAFRLNALVGLLLLRRVFRLFWAYWLAAMGFSLAIGLTLLFPALWPWLYLLGFVGAGALLNTSHGLRRMLSSARASLLAPLVVLRGRFDSSYFSRAAWA